MSAFILAPAHIDYMVSAAYLWQRDFFRPLPDHPEELAYILEAENFASVSHRYHDWDGPAPDPEDKRKVRRTLRIDPVQLLKAINCYVYQSCEHPRWEASKAHEFCQALRSVAVHHLPGYDDASWGIDSYA